MTKSFKVAGHVFSLTLPDGCSLWKYLSQYDPFIVCNHNQENILFSLEMVETVPEGDKVKVFDAPTEDGQTVVVLFRQGEDWIIDMSQDHSRPVCARVWTSRDFKKARICLLSRKLSDALFSVNNTLMLLYAFKTSVLGTLEMHASMVSNGGKAYLFLGKSGTGKSTHSRLWLENVEGTELMNDDNPIVRVLDDGTVMAYGSPWSGKTPCYRNVEAPVGAFVRIRQHPSNGISRLGLVESYAILYSSCSGFKADDTMGDGLHATMEKIAVSTPFYVLDCLPDREAALLSSATIR